MAKKKKEDIGPKEVLLNNFSKILVDDSLSKPAIYIINPDIIANGGVAALDKLLSDDHLEEIMYNHPDVPVKIIHKQYHAIDTNIMLSTEEARQFVVNVAAFNKKILSEKTPVLDGVLADGSRINVTIPPATATISFTIRKQSHEIITMLDLVNGGMINPRLGAFLWTTIEGLGHHATNMLIVGGTATGKTTFLNGLCMLIPVNERVITIEDTAEVRIMQQNKVPMFSNKEKNITMDMLLKSALRMRPDRILVGEVRGVEAKTLFGAMNTGHNGCMGTLHARSARETITRISNPPLDVPLSMIRDLDLLIVLEKINVNGNEKRVISEVTEVNVLAGDQVSFNQIYKYNPKKDSTLPTGIPSKLRTKLAQESGIDIKQFDKILEDRENIITLASKKQKEMKSFSTLDVFNLFEKNRSHWSKYKGKKKIGLFKRKEEELIDW